MKHHDLPRTSPRLDLRVSPEGKAAAGYRQLLSLLEELGKRLDDRSMSKGDLRRWEQEVIGHLRDREIDQLMRVPEDVEFETVAVAEQRWRNLRSILLARKGLSPQIC